MQKVNLELDDFLRELDLEKVRKSLMNMNSTNYDEEDAVRAVAKKRASGASPLTLSVMNVAMPQNKKSNEEKLSPSEKKRQNRKRMRVDVDYSP